MNAELVVVADDRSGAFEVAARLADGGAGPVPVRPWNVPGPSEDRVVVIDTASRHVNPETAAGRLRLVDGAPTRRRAHKIDSALRGNWAVELVERARRSPVLLVPALPEFGRVCRGGTVLDGGVPVHLGPAGGDVRGGPTGSRPAESLRSAGADRVQELADIDAVEQWVRCPSGVAVADAQDGTDLDAIVAAWAQGEEATVLAGTSAVVGRIPTGQAAIASFPPTRRPGAVLVVCGSLHPAARAQVDELERQGSAVVTVVDDRAVRSLTSTGRLVLVTDPLQGRADAATADATRSALARSVAELFRRATVAVLVVIGGDTADAVLGRTPVVVRGAAGPGSAWALVEHPVDPMVGPLLVVTRSGGFGGRSSLDDLLRSTLSW